MRSIIEIAEVKLTSLQHFAADKRFSVLGQLISHLVFSQETAGEGTDLEQLAISLSRLPEETVHKYLFPVDEDEETEEWIKDLLDKATTEKEIYQVMIDNLLYGAISQWREPESQ